MSRETATKAIQAHILESHPTGCPMGCEECTRLLAEYDVTLTPAERAASVVKTMQGSNKQISHKTYLAETQDRYVELVDLLNRESSPNWDSHDLQGWYEALSEIDREIWDSRAINPKFPSWTFDGSKNVWERRVVNHGPGSNFNVQVNNELI
jgi:hypothetical protein